MKVLVIGASAGTGWATVQALLERGHEVTAFARRASSLPETSPRLQRLDGDVMRPQDVERAVPGHDAVIVTLGIHESALRVRLLGPARTAADVRSAGTRHVVDAMRRHGVRRLVVQSSFGVGPTRPLLPWMFRLVFALLLKPQIDDTERQERIVRDSGLDWVIAQPVNLTDAAVREGACASASGETRSWHVSRHQVAAVLAAAVADAALVGRSLAVSAA